MQTPPPKRRRRQPPPPLSVTHTVTVPIAQSVLVGTPDDALAAFTDDINTLRSIIAATPPLRRTKPFTRYNHFLIGRPPPPPGALSTPGPFSPPAL